MTHRLVTLALAFLSLAGSLQGLRAENRPDGDPVPPADIVISQAPGHITFALDEVPAPERRFSVAKTGDEIAKQIKINPDNQKSIFDTPEYVVLHNSFARAADAAPACSRPIP